MDILLTTFPRNKTQNVGDALITESAIKLIKKRVPSYDPIIYFREDSLEALDKKGLKTILIPGFSVNNDTYPTLFKLYPDISDIYHKIYVVGCSFQNLVATENTYDNYKYNEGTIKLLKSLSRNTGTIPCRDILIHKMLLKNNINSSYIGDLALYDDDKISKKINCPDEIKSVAFTVQHNAKFLPQSKRLLSLIKREFPSSDLYIVHHSKPNKSSKLISDFAISLGYIEKDISGDAENLLFYENIDLHIGYRLHGHIYFLRNRKPSFLMAEDCRSFGISQTGALKTGIFGAIENDGTSVRDVAPYELMKFVRHCIKTEFRDFNKVFSFIDETYHKTVRDYFDSICIKLGWKMPLRHRLKMCINRFILSRKYISNKKIN